MFIYYLIFIGIVGMTMVEVFIGRKSNKNSENTVNSPKWMIPFTKLTSGPDWSLSRPPGLIFDSPDLEDHSSYEKCAFHFI